MGRVESKKFGVAVGFTVALCYLFRIIIMLTTGEQGTIKFFNSLLHGVDISSIIRMDVPFWETILGLLQTFIIGWLIGFCISVIYNYQLKPK